MINLLKFSNRAVNSIFATRGRDWRTSGNLPPVLGLSATSTGPWTIKLSFTPTLEDHTLLQVQRVSGTDLSGLPTPDEDTALSWSNFKIVGMKARSFTDQTCTHGNTYTYRVRWAKRISNGNTWKYGIWSTVTASVPSYTETVYDLENDYEQATYTERLNAALADARTFANASSTNFAIIDFPSASLDLWGDGTGGAVINFPNSTNYNRIWFRGQGKANTTLNFKVNDDGNILDPEDNYIRLGAGFADWEAGEAIGLNTHRMAGNYAQYKVTVLGGSGLAGTDQPTAEEDGGTYIDDAGNTWERVWVPRSYQVGLRGSFCNFGRYSNHKNIKFSDMTIDGGCRPTGVDSNSWYTQKGLIEGWDTSHKAWNFGSATDQFDNICIVNVDAIKFMGEVVYSGAQKGAALYLDNCVIGACNASAVSTAADKYMENSTILAAANGGDESAIYANRGSSNVYQSCTHVNVTFDIRGWWYQSANNPRIKTNPKALYGAATFGDPDTHVTFWECDFSGSERECLGLLNEQRNVYVRGGTMYEANPYNRTASNQPYILASINPKEDYQLAGGLSNLVIDGVHFIREANSSDFAATSYISFVSYYGDMDFTGLLVIGCNFDSRDADSAPGKYVDVSYQPSVGQIELEICYCSSTNDYPSLNERIAYPTNPSVPAKRALTHNNTWADLTRGGTKFYSNSTSPTTSPRNDVINGHDGSQNGTIEPQLNKSPYNYRDGQEVTFTGTWKASTDYLFTQANFPTLPSDILCEDTSEWVKFRWSQDALDWIYVSHSN